MPGRLPRSFYLREDTLEVARDLLGKTLVVPDEAGDRVSGKIVEVEAYMGIEDKAAHSFGGRLTDRTKVIFGPGGTAYVFFVYGVYHQLNVVTGPEDHPHVVLVRAIEPLENLDRMRERRGKMPDRNLTSGPGKLCIALGIDKSFYGEDLTGNRIWLEDTPSVAASEIASGPRVGIDYAGEYVGKPWRYWLKDNPFVSKAPRKASK
ncbi:MAG: DNA-3-methyladenine glycosylase [Aridibacter famidurans]|nr:DNA-3-methyladenine glycosylase [Aridibacter famidurans]